MNKLLEKNKIKIFTSLKSMKIGVGSGVGSGSGVGFGAGSGVGSEAGSRSISQIYGSGDPDPHQNVTDPHHCFRASF